MSKNNVDLIKDLLVANGTITKVDIANVKNANIMATTDLVYIESEEDRSNDSMNCTDYAIACGLAPQFGYEKADGVFTRTPYGDRVVVRASGPTNSVYIGANPDVRYNGVKPMINLDLKSFIKYKDRLIKIDKSLSRCVILGEMPQKLTKLNFIEERGLKKTGREFMGHSRGLNVLNEEYETGGNKYVLVNNPHPYREGVVYPSTGKEVSKKPTYFKVEPIVWNIENWGDLPSEINPSGTGTAKYVVLKAKKVIMAGLPFSLSKNPQVANRWDDSMLRAYLNGQVYILDLQRDNLDQELDFSDCSFIKTCLGYDNQFNMNNSYIQTNNNQQNKEQIQAQELQNPEYKPKEKKAKVKSTNIPQANFALEVTISDEDLSIDEQIQFYIENGKSFMLHGASGVGKTRRVEEADPDFVSIVLRNGMLPEEVIGKTIFPNNDTSKESIWMAPAWYSNLCKKCEEEPEKNHVLFIDEITNVKPAEQSLVFHLVLNRSIGPNMGKLPDNVVVVAAGNNKQESEAAYNMPEPLFRRFEGHIYLKADITEFVTWGAGLRKDGLPKIHPLISRFVATYGDSVFYTAYDSEEPPKYALDPRGWEQVSNIIYANKGVLSRQLIANKIGKENAKNLINFAKQKFITLQDILSGNIRGDIPGNFDAKLALACSLVVVDEENVQTVRRFIKTYLGGEILSTFDYKWVGEDEDRALFLSGIQNSASDIEEDFDNVNFDREPTKEELNKAKSYIGEFSSEKYSRFSK